MLSVSAADPWQRRDVEGNLQDQPGLPQRRSFPDIADRVNALAERIDDADGSCGRPSRPSSFRSAGH
jgi:hypothetical protein